MVSVENAGTVERLVACRSDGENHSVVPAEQTEIERKYDAPLDAAVPELHESGLPRLRKARRKLVTTSVPVVGCRASETRSRREWSCP